MKANMPVDIVAGANALQYQKSIRGDELRGKTSCRAGKIVPHEASVLLREDSVSRAQYNVVFDMAETVHPLMNSVGVDVGAYFIPFAAFERFNGIDAFNKSYMGEKEREADAAPVPFFNTVTFDKTQAFWKTLGIHHPNSTAINNLYLEAYNTLVNWMYRKRSKTLTQRLMTDTSLAQAFWANPLVWHIKPDFDQASMQGEIELQLTAGNLPVKGFGLNTASPTMTSEILRDSAGVANASASRSTDPADWNMQTKGAGGARFPDIWADMAGAGITVSLSNIELAKQIAQFAKSRDKYKGITEEHIKDLLMTGIRVPPEALREPMLLDRKRTIFGYQERHAMDGDNLEKSVTEGKTSVSLNFWTPPMNTGGVILIVSQIVPEQLMERKRDKILSVTAVDELPNPLRDYLDEEKVEAVPNSAVDVLHATPDGTFGYAPLNHEWKRSRVLIGGKFYRPVPDTFVEDRQQFWSVETPNPALNSSFYLVPTDLPHSVFADTLADPFEITTLGGMQIVGNTQFGREFDEDQGNYEIVKEQVEAELIDLDE